ncbi:transcriptional repressor LexA [Vulgatibacter sp.]|uniref:transcriptional repressor LexA n=1 Tax=Vulgatibacter sp. TaxID=1971226 RepID=UPI003564DDBA
MEELTERQLAILGYIAQHIQQQRFPPTIREIGTAMGIRSTNGVNDHLKALERKGFLARGEMKSRALVPTPKAWDALGTDVPLAENVSTALPRKAAANDDLLEVPLLGKVAAGAPILAEENLDSTVRIDPNLLGRGGARGSVFALRVSGDSMIGDGIYDGDILFVKKQETARTNEIVVAMIEGEATVKRYFPEGDRIRLQPSNPRLQPIYVRKADARAIQILGIAVGVFRNLE